MHLRLAKAGPNPNLNVEATSCYLEIILKWGETMRYK